MARNWVYAESYGIVYRFSKKMWREMLKQAARGINLNYTHYGKSVCVISHNITDLNPEKAEELLQEAK